MSVLLGGRNVGSSFKQEVPHVQEPSATYLNGLLKFPVTLGSLAWVCVFVWWYVDPQDWTGQLWEQFKHNTVFCWNHVCMGVLAYLGTQRISHALLIAFLYESFTLPGHYYLYAGRHDTWTPEEFDARLEYQWYDTLIIDPGMHFLGVLYAASIQLVTERPPVIFDWDFKFWKKPEPYGWSGLIMRSAIFAVFLSGPRKGYSYWYIISWTVACNVLIYVCITNSTLASWLGWAGAKKKTYRYYMYAWVFMLSAYVILWLSMRPKAWRSTLPHDGGWQNELNLPTIEEWKLEESGKRFAPVMAGVALGGVALNVLVKLMK